MNNLLRIFYAPTEVFAGIPEKPRWHIPFVSTLILSCLASALIVNSVGMENLVRRQLRAQPQLVTRLGEEKIEEIARQADSPARQASAYIGGVLGAGVTILIVAAVFTALLAMTGAGAGFRNVFSVTAYSYFAYYAVLLALSAMTLFIIGDKESIDPNNMLQSHIATFLDRATTNKALFSIATSLDIFSFGLLFMLVLGLSKVSKQVTFARSASVVLGVWAVYVAAKAGIALLF
jgi:Yip1 domain